VFQLATFALKTDAPLKMLLSSASREGSVSCSRNNTCDNTQAVDNANMRQQTTVSELHRARAASRKTLITEVDRRKEWTNSHRFGRKPV
jgi:hypothetical protein